MRIVIVGASGNVGFALARRLAPEPGVELVGVARRVPRAGAVPIAEWRRLQQRVRPTLKELLLAETAKAEIPVPARAIRRRRAPTAFD